MAESPTAADRRAPYVPYPTFEGLIDQLREHPLPAQIDRTILSNNGKRAGGVVNYLAAASRFLGLTDAADMPTPLLKEWHQAKNPEEQKTIFRRILAEAYAPHVQLDSLGTASPKQLDEALRQFGNDGSTHRKARKFLVDAAKAAGVQLSPYISARSRGTYNRRPAGERRTRATEPRAREAAPAPPPPAVDLQKLDLESRIKMLEQVLEILETKGDRGQVYLEATLDVMRNQLSWLTRGSAQV